MEKEKIVFQRVPSLPRSAQHCEPFLVRGAGGKQSTYHWWQPDPSLPGRWWSSGEWKPVEVKTIEEGPATRGNTRDGLTRPTVAPSA